MLQNQPWMLATFYPFQFSPLAPYADFAMMLRTADGPRKE
jgi:hypothetical protein